MAGRGRIIDVQNPLRLRKKHGSGKQTQVTSADGGRLASAQSPRIAVVAGLIVIVIFSMFWITLTEISNRVFPWFTIVLGFMLGYSTQLVGKGTDWRFPVIAAVMTGVGSLIANIILAASVTAEELGIGTLDVLRAATSMTWPVYFDERLTVADGFYAVVAAALAAFYANRRLTRSEYQALRLWREEQAQG